MTSTPEQAPSSGFSLIELLVAAAVFSFIIISVSALFIQALDIQRRAAGIQRIEENAQFVMESIAREVRVSVVAPLDGCAGALDLEHPTNGTVSYEFEESDGTITRDAAGSGPQQITSDDVRFTNFSFCIKGAVQLDERPARVMMTATIESVGGRAATRVQATVQTTIVSRDLASEFP